MEFRFRFHIKSETQPHVGATIDLMRHWLKNYQIKNDVTIVEIVDAELIGDQEYGSMGKNPVDRMKTLLGNLDSMRRSKARGSSITDEKKCLSHKFVGQVEKIFENLPKPLEWRSFYRHDLPLLLDISKEGQDVSV